MKTNYNNLNIPFFYFIFFLLFFSALSSCQDRGPKNYATTECSVLIDITSSNMPSLQHISSDELIKLYRLEANSSSAGIYRQAFLTETFLNYTHQYYLKGVGSLLTSNSFDREDEVKFFKEQIASAIQEIQSVQKNRPSSSVYVPICRELRRLSNSGSNQKILLAYTDLKENSDYLSFLSDRFQRELIENPKNIERYFQNEMALPEDLSGVKVYIIHEPRDSDNAIFKRLSRVYKSMIEKRGGTVYVQANLLL